MRENNLKQILLQCYDLVTDNEYLDKYVDLILANLSTAKADGTQSHHVIPAIYYRKLYDLPFKRNRIEATHLADEDKNNFRVNLKYSDHLLAHAYLALCAKEDWFKFSNANMITFATKLSSAEDLLALTSLDAYQKAYEELIRQKHKIRLTEEHKAKIAKAHKSENMSAEYHAKLSATNKRRIWTEESKNKLRESSIKNGLGKRVAAWSKEHRIATGTIWMRNDELNKVIRVLPIEADKYKALGYYWGRAKTITITKGRYQKKNILAKEWPEYQKLGWHWKCWDKYYKKN